MELRPYQKAFIEKVRYAIMQGNRRVCAVLGCGGGKTACFTYMAKRHKGNVAFLVHRQELVEQTIKAFDGDMPSNVYVGMIRSQLPFEPTLIIIDECHHAVARTYINVIDKYPNAYLIGLTATPCRLDNAGLGRVFDCIVEGVSTEWLIDNNYLCHYDYYAPPSEVMIPRVKFGNFANDEIEYTPKIYGNIKDYIDPSRKTIIYCPNIAFSKAIASAVGGVHFDGETPDKERHEIVEAFRNGEIRILCNVDLIGEGFDVPDCDCVILLRPTMSLSLYIQQAMRCMRYREGKRAVIYDMVGNIHRFGNPTDSHEWTLEGKVKSIGEDKINVSVCPKCYRAYASKCRICPYCHYERPMTQREIKIDEAIRLEQMRVQKRKQQGRARDYETLVQIGKQRGYKNPQYWARMVLNGRSKNI